MHETLDNGERARNRAVAALEGLSVGDAFGQTFFGSIERAQGRIEHRIVEPGPWPWTDDTAMALSIVQVLRESGTIDQDLLASAFGGAYRSEPWRGYGPAMFSLLERYVDGADWRAMAAAQFGGTGSFGNGSAMRVAPVGAYFADDLDLAASSAADSAVVTHAHPEAVAGAVAVAVASALAAGDPSLAGTSFITEVAERTPKGEVRDGLRKAALVPGEMDVLAVALVLGSGSDISCQDTVPFTVWSAAHRLDDFEAAMWTTVAGFGDMDTTCAIVGGIVGARVGVEGIPEPWRAAREPLP
ncbi:MAG TPA: ADP-ribosylglycohydrolase family protein [Actinomycetota bacterium]|jgi:ADP-ribosylglycohydrolase